MDYSTLTNAQLGALCLERGLPNYGNKTQLIERLAKHDAAQAAPQETTTVTDDDFPDLGEDTSDTLTPPAVPVPVQAGAADAAAAQAQQLAELQATVRDMQAALAAATGGKVEGGERASDATIDKVLNSERVFRFEFPLPPAAGLGDDLHNTFRAQIATKARDAGFRTRGDGRRVGSRFNEAGEFVHIYEIYARK